MALIDSKQLSKNLSGSFAVNTGSFFVSGSDNPTQGSYVLSTSGSIKTHAMHYAFTFLTVSIIWSRTLYATVRFNEIMNL